MDGGSEGVDFVQKVRRGGESINVVLLITPVWKFWQGQGCLHKPNWLCCA